MAVAALPMPLNDADTVRFKGTVKRGQSYGHKVREGLMFGLDPQKEGDPCQGWQIWVGPSVGTKTYALIATTPHFHDLIETDICGSDFRNSDNSGPNAPGEKNVNRPQRVRRFRFVANQGDYEALERNASTEHVHNGTLTITRLSLGNLSAGTRPVIERMGFTVELDLGKR